MKLEPCKHGYHMYGSSFHLPWQDAAFFFSKLTNLNFSQDTVACTENRLPTELENLKISGLKALGNFQKPRI